MSLMGSLCLYHSLLGDTLSQMQAIARCMVSNARHSANVVLMLGQRRRRWPNINTTLDHHLVFDPFPRRFDAVADIESTPGRHFGVAGSRAKAILISISTPS